MSILFQTLTLHLRPGSLLEALRRGAVGPLGPADGLWEGFDEGGGGRGVVEQHGGGGGGGREGRGPPGEGVRLEGILDGLGGVGVQCGGLEQTRSRLYTYITQL